MQFSSPKLLNNSSLGSTISAHMLLSQHTFGQHLPPSTKTCTTALPKAWTTAFLFSPSSNTCKTAAAPATLGHAWQHLDQLLDSTTLHSRQNLQDNNNTLQHQQQLQGLGAKLKGPGE
jgi:hypothetical protein